MAQHLHLETRGVIARKGTLIDATIVEAAITPWWGKTRRSRRATPGRLDQKNRKSPFGYKAHIAVEQGSGMIRGAILSSFIALDQGRSGLAVMQVGGASVAKCIKMTQ